LQKQRTNTRLTASSKPTAPLGALAVSGILLVRHGADARRGPSCRWVAKKQHGCSKEKQSFACCSTNWRAPQFTADSPVVIRLKQCVKAISKPAVLLLVTASAVAVILRPFVYIYIYMYYYITCMTSM